MTMRTTSRCSPHVVEHVPEPEPLLGEAARLAPRVLVEVPLEANRSARRPAVRRGGGAHRPRACVRSAGTCETCAPRPACRVVHELTDPLSHEHHAFFAESTGDRARAAIKAVVRRAAFRASPAHCRAPVHSALRMSCRASVDVALLSASPTLGWRMADDAFAALIRDAVATCTVVRVSTGRAGALKRQMALTDAVEALAAHHSAARLPDARAVVLSTVSASFFVRPRVPHAVRFDAPAALNRPGVWGAWQRAAERRSRPAQTCCCRGVRRPRRRCETRGASCRSASRLSQWRARRSATLRHWRRRKPHKRGLEVLCAAWATSGLAGPLIVGGISAQSGRAWAGALRRPGAGRA